MASLKLKSADFEEIAKLQGKHVIVLISNGQIKVGNLPDHGKIEITTRDSKVHQVKEEISTLF